MWRSRFSILLLLAISLVTDVRAAPHRVRLHIDGHDEIYSILRRELESLPNVEVSRSSGEYTISVFVAPMPRESGFAVSHVIVKGSRLFHHVVFVGMSPDFDRIGSHIAAEFEVHFVSK